MMKINYANLDGDSQLHIRYRGKSRCVDLVVAML